MCLHAIQIVDRMAKDKIQMDIVTYSAAVSACEKAGKWLSASVLLDRIA